MSLSLSNCNTDASSSTDLNAQQSPLLHLPAEIRNRIYELVLGGNRLHLSPRRDNWDHCYKPTICGVDPDNEDIKEVFQAFYNGDTGAERMDPQNLSFHELHEDCKRRTIDWSICKPSDYLSLSLLRVCRQIHQEAALLPFSLNTFITTRMEDLVDFAATLTASQRGAIEALSLRVGSFFEYLSDYPIALPRFEGLRSLTLNVELFRIPGEPGEPTSLVGSFHIESIPSIFSQQSFTDVKVGVFKVTKSEHNLRTMVRVQEYPGLAREYEAALLNASSRLSEDEAK